MRSLLPFVVAISMIAGARPASAHCDTVHGPVVTAARAALDAGDPRLVLHWVRAEDEPAIRAAFEQTLAVRALGPQARALADRYFFETVVRIHRAGEGAPYTGLSDAEPDSIIAATDRALEQGSPAQLEAQLVAAIHEGLAKRFAAARAARGFEPGDVAAGRVYVAAYVPLTHWVEGVFAAAEAEHHAEPATHEEQHAGVAAGATTEPPRLSGVLPWILTGLCAIGLIVMAALLVQRRPVATA